MLTNASPWSSPGLELPLRATILLIASYLPKYLHTNILGWFFPVIYLGNPTYCLLLQDRTDYWAYSSGHLDLTLRLYLLVIDPWSVQYSSTLVKRGILTKHMLFSKINITNITITGLTLKEVKKNFNKFYLNCALLLGQNRLLVLLINFFPCSFL